jgi:uracil-DNA glycosylase family 4
MAYQSVDQVGAAIVGCDRCVRLRRYCRAVARTKVLRFRREEYWGKPVPGFGDPDATVLVVGLAPAAHGGNRTGRVFTGDSSGDWLYEALHRFGFANQPTSVGIDDGLLLTGCYVTASARCAPPANKPLPVELSRCQEYLAEEIRLLGQIRVVVTLGKIAHEAFLRASGWRERLRPKERPRFGHGMRALLPDGRTVLSSYHPSRQNTNTGRLTREMWHDVFRTTRRLA